MFISFRNDIPFLEISKKIIGLAIDDKYKMYKLYVIFKYL